MAATLIVGERRPQVLEKVVWQRYFVTDCSLLLFLQQSFATVIAVSSVFFKGQANGSR